MLVPYLVLPPADLVRATRRRARYVGLFTACLLAFVALTLPQTVTALRINDWTTGTYGHALRVLMVDLVATGAILRNLIVLIETRIAVRLDWSIAMPTAEDERLPLLEGWLREDGRRREIAVICGGLACFALSLACKDMAPPGALFALCFSVVGAFGGGCLGLALSDLWAVGFHGAKYVKAFTAMAALETIGRGELTPPGFASCQTLGACVFAFMLFWIVPGYARIDSDAIYLRPAAEDAVRIWRYDDITGFERYRYHAHKAPSCWAYELHFRSGETVPLLELGVGCRLQEKAFQWIQARRSNPALKRTPGFVVPIS